MSTIEKEKSCARAVFKYVPNFIAWLKILLSFHSPDHKSLASLWHDYGYPRNKRLQLKTKNTSRTPRKKTNYPVSSESRDDLACLYDWLVILYGQETADWCNPHKLIDKFQYKSNPLVGSSTLINRRKPFDTMLLKVSDALPLYSDIEGIDILRSEIASGGYNIEHIINANDIVVGGLYATQNADGTYSALKVLAVDDLAVHIRTYANVFSSPRDIYQYENTLTLGYFSDSEKYGIGHLPITVEGFWESAPLFVKDTDIEDDELEGYRIFIEEVDDE